MADRRARRAVAPEPLIWAGLVILSMLTTIPSSSRGDAPIGASGNRTAGVGVGDLVGGSAGGGAVGPTDRRDPEGSAGLADDPAIEVWFTEGCDATYPIGAWLHMRYRANVAGLARVWRYPDRELFVQDWLEPGQTHEILGPVTGPPGRWWILGELLESGATATCHYTTTDALTVTATLSPTATLPHETTESPTPSDLTPSPGPSREPATTPSPEPSRPPEPTITATSTEPARPPETPVATETLRPTESAVPAEPTGPTLPPEATGAPTGAASPTPTTPDPPVPTPLGTPVGTPVDSETATPAAASRPCRLWLPELFRRAGVPPHPSRPSLRR